MADPDLKRSRHTQAVVLVTVLMVALVTAVAGIRRALAGARQRSAEAVAAQAGLIQQNLQFLLRSDQDYLTLLAWERAQGGLVRARFQDRAAAYVAAHPELINITWVDPDLTISDVAPLAGNAQILGLRLSLPEPARVARLARARRTPQVGRPFEAIQGRPSFEVTVPVFRGETFQGLLVGVFATERLLQAAVPPSLVRDLRLELRDGDGALLGEAAPPGRVRPATAARVVDLTPPGNGMTLVAQGVRPPVAIGASLFAGLSVALGLAAALALVRLRRGSLARARAEADLQETRMAFQEALEYLPIPIAMTTGDGRISHVNQSFVETFGWTAGDLPTFATWLERAYPDPGYRAASLAQWTADLAQAQARLGSTQPREYQVTCKDGTVRPTVISGRQIGPWLVGTFIDVSAEREAEREQARLQAELMHAQKMECIGSLSGGVAHDMNNVLAAILALASASLHGEPSPERTRKTFETIIQAAVRGGEMVHRLLAFARRSPARQEAVDLNALLGEEAGLLERTTLSRVSLVMDLAPDLRPIRGDAAALSHAVMNLCVNAVDAMPETGTLTLATRNLDSGQVELRVEDTGAGMPPEVLARATDPYFTTKPEGKGTGLGLSLVYSTVKAHEGDLEIQSDPGRGTRIRLRFPAMSAAAGPSAAPAAAPRSGGPLDVLLVDDDELIQASTTVLLDTLGHRHRTARSGEQALALLRGGYRPDAVILDLNMPGMGGAGALRGLRALAPDLPVLLATGRPDQTALDLVRDHDRTTLLAKPFRLEELRDRLQRCREATG